MHSAQANIVRVVTTSQAIPSNNHSEMWALHTGPPSITAAHTGRWSQLTGQAAALHPLRMSLQHSTSFSARHKTEARISTNPGVQNKEKEIKEQKEPRQKLEIKKAEIKLLCYYPNTLIHRSSLPHMETQWFKTRTIRLGISGSSVCFRQRQCF